MLVIVIWFMMHTIEMEKKRTKAIEELAASLGFTFSPGPTPALEASLGSFQLFKKGHSRKVRNVLRQEKGDLTINQFDYTYTVGSGKSSSTYQQTVTLFQARALSLPSFVMGPENFFHKIGEFLGHNDIDFVEAPEFSRRYLLKGTDEGAIRQLFSDEVTGFFGGKPDFSIEGNAGSLLVYRLRKRATPEELPATIEEGLEVFKLLLKSASRT
jgi:hypothetical protein